MYVRLGKTTRIMVATLAIMLSVLSPLWCAGGRESTSKPLSVVATIFPEYDWVRVILGDNPAGMDVTLLLDSSSDLHNYQPSPADILKISTCDLFICVGGESDKWVDDVLASSSNKSMTVLRLLDSLGSLAKEEAGIEGMQTESHEAELDEHVWLSLRNAEIFCSAIAGALSAIDPDNSNVYESNLEEYRQRLSDLDGRYSKMVESSFRKVLLFGDRFPFRYLADDYGLECYAAFSGCSAETEASFETVAFLVEKVNSLRLGSIIVIEGSDGRIARTIAENSESKDQNILVLNSIQSVSPNDMKAGASYLGLMERNLETLEKALN